MNAIQSPQPFKYEFIAGISLSTDSQRSHRNTSTKEQQIHPNKQIFNLSSDQQQKQSSPTKSLEIVGSEIGPKLTSPTTNHQFLTRQTTSLNTPKIKLARVDQTVLQLPKRTTFTHRKTPENALSRTWSSHVPFSSQLQTTDKLTITSPSRRANTSTDTSDDKSIMVQHPTLNSSITVLKKLPTTNNNQLSPRSSKKSFPPIASLGRETTSIKLPTLVKRTPSSITKPIPSAYIQDSSRLISNRPILQPTTILPIYSPRRSVAIINGHQHLPVIKERMIKANLAQKASFKCKSPLPHRPDSSLSRSTTAVLTASQVQMKTFNPLKHMDVSLLLNEATRNRLKKLFLQLDTDKDGHLTYPQVQKCLPPSLPRAQETFFRVLYDITSETTFFGLQEFYATAVLIEMIAQQNPHIWNSLLDDVDFNYYRDDVLELLEEFDSRHSPVTSTINFDSLVALIMNRTSNGKYEHISKELEALIPLIKTMHFTRLEFIALIPALIYIESCFDQGKALFRFRDNSILDSHIQKALFI